MKRFFLVSTFTAEHPTELWPKLIIRCQRIQLPGVKLLSRHLSPDSRDTRSMLQLTIRSNQISLYLFILAKQPETQESLISKLLRVNLVIPSIEEFDVFPYFDSVLRRIPQSTITDLKATNNDVVVPDKSFIDTRVVTNRDIK